MDDDDAFLYGETATVGGRAEAAVTSVQPVSLDAIIAANALMGAKAEEESPPFGPPPPTEDEDENKESQDLREEDEDEDEDEEEESDDDIEIIMEPTSRSLDFRQQNATSRRPPSQAMATKPSPSQLTTEYTPRDRGVPAKPDPSPSAQSSQLAHPTPLDPRTSEGPDPSTLPPATAPPSHPSINPDMPGMLDGRSILEVDMTAMSEKPWRRPGSDISDWFNYGFDEISWEAYCYRRRDLGDLATVLKTNVLNFAAMTEDQLTALPPELRTMVMTGANAMMNQSSTANMMGANVGMNPMMDMSGMGAMNIPMGMGMNGDLTMQMQAGGPMMQEGPGPVGSVVTNGTPEQGGVQMGMQDGFGGGGPGPGMMGMAMGGDYGMQEQGPMGQGMYSGMESSTTPLAVPVQTPVPVPGPAAVPTHPSRGASQPTQFRGRAMAQGLRGRGMFGGRGRGRYDGPPPGPVRPASPLPPGVPTGPRNQNRYKDRDGNAPAVEGLDYGGTAKDGSTRTPSGEPEDRGHNRKRRSSASLEDARGTKRR